MDDRTFRPRRDLASALFGDDDVEPEGLRVVRSALTRLEERRRADATAAPVPEDLLAEALAAAAGRPPQPTPRRWLRLAAGIAIVSVAGVAGFAMLPDPTPTRQAQRPITVQPLDDRERELLEAATQAFQGTPVTIALTPQLRQALAAYAADPGRHPNEMLAALGAQAGDARRVRIDDALGELLRQGRAPSRIQLDRRRDDVLLLRTAEPR